MDIKPVESDPKYSQWVAENSLVMSWLLNSMQANIGFLLLDTSNIIWTAVAHTYSQTSNDALAYELRKKVRETNQMDMAVSRYYAELCSLWKELDYYQNFQPKCLMMLQVLGRDPFPPYDKHMHMFSKRKAGGVLCCILLHMTILPWLLILKKSTKLAQSQVFYKEVSESSPYSTGSDGSIFSRLEMQTLRHLMAGLDVSSASTSASNLATSNFPYIGTSAFHVFSSTPWNIDLGATDHMTSSSNLFFVYFPCFGKAKVRIADGSLSSVSGKGSVHRSSSMSLSSVLHGPNLSVNLLSVSRIIESLNCHVSFFSTHCLFQEMGIGRMIGSGRAHGGLYFLDDDFSLDLKKLAKGGAL
ncbi:Retrovirus-related Pol polyprotein from transposon TNT 1-94 [Quillaja saponaria]|uniref:Retrovirus-related Pol polyprotein from transposon TNT 1-94 n=1 Tax=Quillaja saponaria TaxID=32244 RepID=A0AAD7Q732_QUISA|nr:Retrovirus-related Pol polyprotein from transposon TNT 1-94 [Quillaja saponaria]